MNKPKHVIEAPMGETKVLLHTCCAPCSSAIIEAMLNNGITPVIYYCNPNIYPLDEYLIRKDECTRYAQSLGLEIVDADYDHDNWLEQMRGLENEPERGGRCLKCFKLRLLRTALYARDNGFKVITTTLASSRWKSLDQINEAGQWAVDECRQGSVIGLVRRISAAPLVSGRCSENIVATTAPDNIPVPPDDSVIWWNQNWRKNGLQERRNQIIKEYDFYNQLYCGCEFSMRKESSSVSEENQKK